MKTYLYGPMLVLFLIWLAPGLARAEELPAYGGGFSTPTAAPTPVATPCSEPVCKTCVPVASVKKITHVEYEVKDVEYCQKKCPGFHLFQAPDCPSSDPCPTCGHVRHKRVLMKRIVTEEVPTTDCVPALVPKAPCPTCADGATPIGAAKP